MVICRDASNGAKYRNVQIAEMSQGFKEAATHDSWTQACPLGVQSTLGLACAKLGQHGNHMRLGMNQRDRSKARFILVEETTSCMLRLFGHSSSFAVYRTWQKS